MFPVVYLTVCYLYLAECTAWINPSILYDIASGKEAATMSGRYSVHYFQNGVNRTCDKLHTEHSSEPAVYLIDLRERYPIILINITIYSTVSITGGIKVIVDDRLCAVPNFINGTNMVKCISDTAGRVFTIKAYLNVTICKVQIFTCTAGKRGASCNALCVNGTYGMACRPCNCRGNESCRKTDGFCPLGCLGASYYKNYDCYYTSISRKDDGHFAILTEAYVRGITFIPSFSRNEIILRKASDYYGNEQNCTFFESRANSKVAIVEVSYQPPIVVGHVVITYCHIDISPPYSMRITVNGRSCFGMTSHSLLPLGTHTFTCQKTTAAGNTLIISYTSHNLISNSTVVVGLSKIAVLACAKGFYGSSCKLPCHCLGSTCDPVTGYCPSGLCGISARGRNCASVNIAFLRPVLGRASVGHVSIGLIIFAIY